MIKKFFKYILYFLILIIIGIIYLSYFGIETKRFNQLIQNEISKNIKKIDIALKDVKIVLNLTNFSVGLKAYDPDIIFKNQTINLKKIEIRFSIESFLKKEFAIKNLSILTKENNLKNIINLVQAYQNSPQLFIFDKMTKSGILTANINLNFNNKGKVRKDYNIKGLIKNTNLRLLNNQTINNINLNFNITDSKYLFKDVKAEFNQSKLISKIIKIKNKNKFFLIQGDLENINEIVNDEVLSFLFKNKLNNMGLSNLNFISKNNFSFKLNKKLKFSDINIESKITLKKANYKIDFLKLKNYLPNFNNLIELNDHKIELIFNKKNFLIKGKGKFFVDKKSDEINYDIKFDKEGNYDFKSIIQFKNNPIIIKILNYEKDENKNSILNIEGSFKKNKTMIFQKILFEELKNKFLINGLSLNKNFKINDIDKIDLNFFNKNKKENKIFLNKNKKNYEISGKVFDGSNLLDEMLKSDTKKNAFDILNNFNTSVKLNVDQIYIDNFTYLNSIKGSLKLLKSNLVNLNLKASFDSEKKLTFTIKTNANGEKITTLFSEYAKPLVKKFRFIKGFEEGSLDFYSIKKNNSSKSKLKIYDFKLNELPALTKILTLASLQGIADLLTGEGIRFNEFEMNFNNNNNLMTIDEIYAIGPAISILMDGYIENNKLVSLRGTLVPATTLNKIIGSIPLLGNILVGKKTGEGVFGVSFKIKGAPKNLKTTVNPIKTLTPRFITRTLEKIKKIN